MGRQAMSAIYILWLRELKRFVRSRAQIMLSLGQPTLYLLALGFGFGPDQLLKEVGSSGGHCVVAVRSGKTTREL